MGKDNSRNNGKKHNARKKKTKQRRLNSKGSLRIPPVALAYFYNNERQLRIVFPVTGEHPDVTIKRTVNRSGIVPSPASVKVTPRYFDMVKNLPSSSVELVNKKALEKSIFDAELTDDQEKVSEEKETIDEKTGEPEGETDSDSSTSSE